MKAIILTLLVSICYIAATAAPTKDTIVKYFAEGGYVASYESADYYEMTWKDDSLWHVGRYTMNDKPEILACFQDDSLKILTGNCLRYHKNGLLSEKTTYVNGRMNGPQVWYHPNGQKSEESIYKDDSAINVSLWTETGMPDSAGVPGITLPQFGLRRDMLNQYLSANLHYPEEARDKGIQGRIVIRFLVLEAGTIDDPRVFISSGNRALDAEGLRVVRGMPKWIPGTSHNRIVKEFFTLPITFKLD